MNFNYSYRAFLVTSLLFGILFLTLWSIKISAEIEEVLVHTPVEYIEIDPIAEEVPEIAINNNAVIESNRAYNEAEKFIRESEQERLNNPLNQVSSTVNTNNTVTTEQSTISNATQNAIEEAKKRIAENKKNRAEIKKNKSSNANGYSRKTTISYNLKSRKAITLRNPVYTCEGGGKVVIDIEVTANGYVSKTDFNKSASTTTNGCLVESAVSYAEVAKFSISNVESQKGSITYNFPGQHK